MGVWGPVVTALIGVGAAMAVVELGAAVLRASVRASDPDGGDL